MRGIRRQPRKKFKPTFGMKKTITLHCTLSLFGSLVPTRVSAVDLNISNDSSEKVLSQIIIVSISVVKLIGVGAGRSWQNNSWMKIDAACSSWLLGWLMIKPLCCLFEMKIHEVYWKHFFSPAKLSSCDSRCERFHEHRNFCWKANFSKSRLKQSSGSRKKAKSVKRVCNLNGIYNTIYNIFAQLLTNALLVSP